MMTKLSFWVNYSFKAILYTSILSLPFSGFATAEWYAQPIWHVFTPDAFPDTTPPWECTNSCKLSARTHSQTFTHYGQFPLSNSSIRYVFGLWGKSEHPEETHADMGTCTKNMPIPHRKASWLSWDLNQGPSCCEATVQPTEPPPLYTSILFKAPQHYKYIYYIYLYC